jgi:hypothetical protein
MTIGKKSVGHSWGLILKEGEGMHEMGVKESNYDGKVWGI